MWVPHTLFSYTVFSHFQLVISSVKDASDNSLEEKVIVISSLSKMKKKS